MDEAADNMIDDNFINEQRKEKHELLTSSGNLAAILEETIDCKGEGGKKEPAVIANKVMESNLYKLIKYQHQIYIIDNKKKDELFQEKYNLIHDIVLQLMRILLCNISTNTTIKDLLTIYINAEGKWEDNFMDKIKEISEEEAKLWNVNEYIDTLFNFDEKEKDGDDEMDEIIALKEKTFVPPEEITAEEEARLDLLPLDEPTYDKWDINKDEEGDGSEEPGAGEGGGGRNKYGGGICTHITGPCDVEWIEGSDNFIVDNVAELELQAESGDAFYPTLRNFLETGKEKRAYWSVSKIDDIISKLKLDVHDNKKIELLIRKNYLTPAQDPGENIETFDQILNALNKKQLVEESIF